MIDTLFSAFEGLTGSTGKAFKNLKQLWQGEINGTVFAKNMIDSLCSTFGGGHAGAAFGKAVLGSGIGEYMGALLDEYCRRKASRYTTE